MWFNRMHFFVLILDLFLNYTTLRYNAEIFNLNDLCIRGLK